MKKSDHHPQPLAKSAVPEETATGLTSCVSDGSRVNLIRVTTATKTFVNKPFLIVPFFAVVDMVL